MYGLTFINAEIGGAEAQTLRVAGGRIAEVGGDPQTGDRVVDLNGDRLLPGLINAHEHLQLNNLPALGRDEPYGNVREWIFDVNARREADAAFEAGVAVTREERLLLGGVKNLLSGVTTVAHHDPLYPCLRDPLYPTHVVTDFGWSHSLYIDGDESVCASYGNTPTEWPWIIHAAEGVDDEAQQEFERLEALGCLGANTLMVHGVALSQAQALRLGQADAGLIWCPASNLRLFGRTADVGGLVAGGRVALGTDSRLSGSRDLFAELRVAASVGGFDEPTLESLVTTAGARLLRLSDRGSLRAGARADLLILPARKPLSRATRADVRLVMLDGMARYGDTDYVRAVSPYVDWVRVQVDGRSKVLSRSIAAPLFAAQLKEPGVEFASVAWRAA